MPSKDEFVSYSPIPSNPNPNPNSYPNPYPNPNDYSYGYPQNVVVLLPSYRPRSRLRHRRCICYSAALLLFLLLAAGIVFLYPSDPEIRLARIRINHIGIRTSPKPILDLSFALTVKVRNRDFFSLSYDSIAVAIGYRGRQLGVVNSVDGGRIKARGSSYADVVLTVDGFEVIYDAFYLLQDIAKGVIPFDTETRVEGKLGLFFFDVPLKATVSCGVYVDIKQQRVVRQDCYPESLGDSVDQDLDIGVRDTLDIGAGDI